MRQKVQRLLRFGILPAGYYDVYQATFEVSGIQYEITAQRLELERASVRLQRGMWESAEKTAERLENKFSHIELINLAYK